MKDYRKVLSENRSAIMGLMAILIIVYHAKWITNNWLFDNTINKFGSIGVDVFIFVSGFGIAYALTKYDSFEKYYGKRLGRILPPYYAFEIFNSLLAIVLAAIGINNNLMQPLESWLVPVGVWVNQDPHRNLSYKWYISAILGFYLLAAVIYPAMKKSKHLYLTTVIFLFITISFIPYIAEMGNMPFAIQRIPVLVIGLAVGVASLRKEKEYQKPTLGLILLTLLCIIGILMFIFEGKLPGKYLSTLVDPSNIFIRQALIAPLFTILLAYLFELIKHIKLNRVVKYFAWLGTLSLELYLIHSIISGIFELTAIPKGIQVLFTVILSIPAAVFLKWLSDKLIMLWRKMSKYIIAKDNNMKKIGEIK